MCGIGAIINGNIEQLTGLMQPVEQRGESFNEHVIIKNVALSCNRLKIVDQNNAKQPLTNEDQTIFAVLNGEIYNFKELKKVLIEKGHLFKTDSDTEVLVHGYEEWKENLPKKLDGQFAFVVYDNKSKEFLAARDHFGIKPLFYSKQKNTFYFASELKQLVNFVDKIEIVEPGTFVNNKGKEEYYSLPSPESAIERIQTLFNQAVKKRVQTDLPIAVFLSGGLDSTAVLATAKKYHNNITAICLGRKWESEDSDYFIALRYCQENNIKLIHQELPTEEELFELVPEIVKITESFEPNLIKQSALSYHLAKVAKNNGFKVALCGEGADEVFAGYPEFIGIKEQEVQQLSRNFFKNLYRTQLQRVDKTAMNHTLEVRVPFMDLALVEYGLNLPARLKVKGKVTKWILRKALADRLPEYIVNRKKVVLSEGMGYKGNSLVDGLFTKIATSKISNQQLENYKKEFPHLQIQTKEEALYFQHYLQAGYHKFSEKTRPNVNKTHSTGNVQELVNILSSRKYNRHKMNDKKALYTKVSSAVENNKPIPIVGYWGITNKEKINEQDKTALNVLQHMNERVKKIYNLGIKITFLISDSHALMNSYRKEAFKRYVKEIKNLFSSYKFINYFMLSEIREKNKEEMTNINLIAFNPKEELLPLLIKGAEKMFKGNINEGIKKYYQTRKQEAEIIKKEFAESTFFTYNCPQYQEIFPNLPTLFLFSGIGTKPPWLK